MANNNSTALPELELLDIGAACAQVGGCSKNHFYDMIKKGQMPKPIKVGSMMSRWIKAEVIAALHAFAEQRGTSTRRDGAAGNAASVLARRAAKTQPAAQK